MMTLFLASLAVEMASTEEVSSTRPCGIMPTSAATVVRMDWLIVEPSCSVRRNSRMPTGASSRVAQRMIMLSVLMISDLAPLTYLASALMREA